MKDKIDAVVDRATDYSGSKKRKAAKGILGVIIVMLLGAFGLEMFEKDIDLGAVIDGESMSDAQIIRDEDGNLVENEDGSLLTRILRDREGNEVLEGTTGAKYTDEYNCDDFATQPEAQKFFENAGGVRADTNRLDGDKDSEACESLPKGSQ